MAKNETLKTLFHEAMEENFKNRFCEEVTKTIKLHEKEGRIWYLPLQGVLDLSRSSTKLRIVYDGSSKYQGTSLNENIYAGPKLQPDLVELLMRFRLGRYTLTSDISKMFNQIRLDESEKDYFRFLYRKNTKEDIKEYRFTRIVFGINSSPFQSIMTIITLCHEMNSEYPEVANIVRKFLYVDDFIYSNDKISKLKRIIGDTIEMFQRGGFKLTKFHTNCKDIIKDVPKSSLHPSIQYYKDEDLPKETIFKALGLEFQGYSDQFSFNLTKLIEEWNYPVNATKRTILSDTAKIFDPLGLLSPLITTLKIFIQDLWIRKLKWDTKLPSDLLSQWYDIYGQFANSAERIVFDRYLFSENENLIFKKPDKVKNKVKKADVKKSVLTKSNKSKVTLINNADSLMGVSTLDSNSTEKINLKCNEKFLKAQNVELDEQKQRNKNICLTLHGFCDASIRSYAGVIYVRYLKQGRTHVSLVMGKSKLAPMKRLSIPRLELEAAVLLSKMMTYVRKIITVESKNCFLYGDSQIVQAWLTKHPQTLKVFCANRIATIQKETDGNNWLFVKGKENPADLNSRGLYPKDFNHSKLWFKGPDFLPLDFEFHPKPESKEDVDKKLTEEEEKLIELEQVDVSIHLFVEEKYFKNALSLFKDKNGKIIFDNLDELLRIFQLVCTASSIFMKKKKVFSRSKTLTHLILDEQKKAFSNERIQQLQELQPYVENELLVTKGRLRNLLTKGLIILPGKNDLTKLIILNEHQSLLCVGPDQVLASLRNKYWIIGGKRIVRDTIRKYCFKCKRRYAQQGFEIMAQLPKTRLIATRPFQATGFDAFGPLGITDSNLNVHGLIFVCTFTRYTHVELATNLTAQEILHCWDRFTARFMSPEIVYSDNFKSFKKLAEILSKNQELFQRYFEQKSIKWHFIPARSPHVGGHYERLVAVIKNPLKNALKTKILSFRELDTVMIKILTIVNNRPVTFTSEDPTDLEPLTPNHLMYGQLMIQPEWKIDTNSGLSKAYRVRQRLVQQFWKNFSAEYIKSLLPYPKWTEKNPESNILGKLVLIESPYRNRDHWPLARVTNYFRDQFGEVRVVSVRTEKGILTRDIRKLYFLDLDPDNIHSEIPEEYNTNQTDEGTQKESRHLNNTREVKKSHGRPKGSKNKIKNNISAATDIIEKSQEKSQSKKKTREVNSKTKKEKIIKSDKEVEKVTTRCGRVSKKPERL